MKTNREKLFELTEILLFSNSSSSLRETCREFFDLFSEIVGEIETEDIFLPSGQAVSPLVAARCVWDFARTSKFLRGLRLAIIEAKKRFPNETIEILYAGSGPFATLAIPLCTQFSPDEIKFTIIDIHEFSLKSAQKVFAEFGFNEFVRDFIQTDAATFQTEQKFHVVVSETMQRSLEHEPQVAITKNLAKVLHENGIFIPEEIKVSLCLIEKRNLEDLMQERDIFVIGEIISLTKDSTSFPPKILEFPEGDFAKYHLIFSTTIKTFDSCLMDNYDSGLTYPQMLRKLDNVKAGQKIKFSYLLGEDPKIEYQLVE